MTVDEPRWRDVGGNAAEQYGRSLAPAMFAPWAPTLVERAGVRPGQRVLDVACGTGVATRAAADATGPDGHVTGLDNSAAMLDVARATSPAAIEWIEASATAMPLPDGSYDIVLCQQGLQQIPDRLAALREMRRVLVPGGRLAILVWSRIEENPGMAALVAALERHVGPEAARNRRAPFALGDSTEVRRLIGDAGFDDLRIETLIEAAGFPSPESIFRYQLASTPLTTIGELSAEICRAIEAEMRSALAGWFAGETFALPMSAHLALARA
ncbi:MAG: class I SAM-dependent methyltransferase [Thermomicrobiales bacterium]|nr:class I SAM-dependent methyltransferase [Thermomicrobiales bacterium]